MFIWFLTCTLELSTPLFLDFLETFFLRLLDEVEEAAV